MITKEAIQEFLSRIGEKSQSMADFMACQLDGGGMSFESLISQPCRTLLEASKHIDPNQRDQLGHVLALCARVQMCNMNGEPTLFAFHDEEDFIPLPLGGRTRPSPAIAALFEMPSRAPAVKDEIDEDRANEEADNFVYDLRMRDEDCHRFFRISYTFHPNLPGLVLRHDGVLDVGTMLIYELSLKSTGSCGMPTPVELPAFIRRARECDAAGVFDFAKNVIVLPTQQSDEAIATRIFAPGSVECDDIQLLSPFSAYHHLDWNCQSYASWALTGIALSDEAEKYRQLVYEVERNLQTPPSSLSTSGANPACDYSPSSSFHVM